MVIEDHPGPNGQTFYADNTPEGHDNPAWFDAVTELFSYHFEKTTLGWEAAAMYVTDYSSVDFTIDEHDGTKYIASFVAPETFARAADVVYVSGSSVLGAMGPDLIPFSAESDAESFAASHGGNVIEYEGIDQAVVAKAMRG